MRAAERYCVCVSAVCGESARKRAGKNLNRHSRRRREQAAGSGGALHHRNKVIKYRDRGPGMCTLNYYYVSPRVSVMRILWNSLDGPDRLCCCLCVWMLAVCVCCCRSVMGETERGGQTFVCCVPNQPLTQNQIAADLILSLSRP
jgi:hypothetical protein